MIEALIIIFGGYLIFSDEPEVNKSPKPEAQVQEVEVETRRAVVTINDGVSQTKHESIIIIGEDNTTKEQGEQATPKKVTRNKDGYIIADLSGD